MDYTNADEVAASLVARGVRATRTTITLTAHYGMLLETAIKAHASGRPGPNVITGDYRRSWTTRDEVHGGEVRTVVGTNKPQARRLEYGFYGVDALGRSYNQPPYPHVGPALQQVAPQYAAALEAALLGGDD